MKFKIPTIMRMIIVLWLPIGIIVNVIVAKNIVQNIARVYYFNVDQSYTFVVDMVADKIQVRCGKYFQNDVFHFISVNKTASRCTLECFLFHLCVKQRRSEARCPRPVNCCCF